MRNEKLVTFCSNQWFTAVIYSLIVINTVILGLLTFDFDSRSMAYLEMVDNIILGVFIAELSLKAIAFGKDFFKDQWNVFDVVVVGISAITALTSVGVFRALRVFKILRLISVFPELRRMIESTSRSVRSIFAITILILFIVYIYAIMSVMLFGESSDAGSEYFADIGKAFFTLFQIMTLDAWAEGIVRDLIAIHGLWVGAFFGSFILATTFTFLNMFIAVFTNAIASVDIEDGDDVGFSRIINELKTEMAELKSLIRDDNETNLSEENSDDQQISSTHE